MDITWHSDFVKSWFDRVTHDRVPHAVLLAGPVGVGKRAAAAWLASQRLQGSGPDTLPVYPFSPPEFPDLRWISVAEDKKTIGIEQIRALVAEFSLTSYEGNGKVAVIEPANDMTASAANSLLKTLEEPPGDALLVLIADRVGRLPATIFSRCQRIDFAAPSEALALTWLNKVQPGPPWADALRMAGGAPLAAIQALQDIDSSTQMSQDLVALSNGSGSAIEVAARWSKLDPGFVFTWLAQQLRLCAVALLAGREQAQGLAIGESVLRRMDRRNLFCYLDIINRLRGQPGGSYNIQLTIEGLLIDWANGLKDCGPRPPTEGMELMRAQ